MKPFMVVASVIALVICVATGSVYAEAAKSAGPTMPVGVARIDVTPDFPVRLVGYADRQTESEGVAQRLWAKALAFGGDDGDGPAVLIEVDNCGVPGTVVEKLAAQLKSKANIRSERVVVCATHTHAGPWLSGFVPTHTNEAMPEEHRQHIVQYTEELGRRLERVALDALAARKPARLAWTTGAVGFAMNRRPVWNNQCKGLGVNPMGHVDRSLPILRVTGADGALMAVLANYACHCTTLTGKFNQYHGDWAGYAQQFLEETYPGAVAMTILGCGADANPHPRGEEPMSRMHGEAVADEVRRLLTGALKPIKPSLTAQRTIIELPLAAVPPRDEFQKRAAAAENPKASAAERRMGLHAKAMLASYDEVCKPIRYPITVWTFGEDLAMVFLPGEVVVDFTLRLKEELDGRRLWVTAYANDMPCYIVTRKILEEGGYEPVSSMLGYGKPASLAPECEDRIIDATKKLMPAAFQLR